MNKDTKLIAEAYEDVVLFEGIGIVPYIPLIIQQVSQLNRTGSGVPVSPEEARNVIAACLALLAVAVGGAAYALGPEIIGALKRARHWFLSKFTNIDVEQIEAAAIKAKEALDSPSKKGSITKWVNRLKVASENKDSASMHEAFEELKNIIKVD